MVAKFEAVGNILPYIRRELITIVVKIILQSLFNFGLRNTIN